MNPKNTSKGKRIKEKKSKDNFEKIKSDFFIRKLFEYMKKDRALEIIKYKKDCKKD